MIELIISAAVGSLILTSGYLCLRAGLAGQDAIDARADAIQNARVALDLMTADLRAATPLSKDFDFLGMRRKIGDADACNLDFATHNYSPQAPREGDICEISYFLAPNEETGTLSLWRRRDPTPDPEPLRGGTREEIAQNVAALRFLYYDGWEWFENWGDAEGDYAETDTALLANNLYGMPEAVRIGIDLIAEDGTKENDADDDEKESEKATLTFETTVRLDLAPISFTSGRSGNNSSTAGDN